MGFEQAAIPIEKEREFTELRGAMERAFAPARVEKFFAALKSQGVRIRDFDSVLAKQVLESVEPVLQQSGARAQALYEALTISDKGQMREFYLGQVEQAPSELRHKFHQVYRDS
ncbi:MAG: hypothetical protein LAN64_19145 [Acidobacteriia bacterium]|nr:hypothetical protein [Terriglobia bacterium]